MSAIISYRSKYVYASFLKLSKDVVQNCTLIEATTNILETF